MNNIYFIKCDNMDKATLVQKYLDGEISTAKFNNMYFYMVRQEAPIKKTTDFVLKSNDPELIAKCVQTDDLQAAESAYMDYKAAEHIEKVALKKQCEDEIKTVMREFNKLYDQDMSKAGETPEQKMARIWSEHSDLWTRYSAASRELQG